jgi:hypothetical protein
MATKTQQIIELFKKHPDWTYDQIAKAVKPEKSTRGNVQNVLSTNGFLSKGKKAKPADDQAVSDFVILSGGLDEAISKLKALSENSAMSFAISANGIAAAIDKVEALKMRLAKK